MKSKQEIKRRIDKIDSIIQLANDGDISYPYNKLARIRHEAKVLGWVLELEEIKNPAIRHIISTKRGGPTIKQLIIKYLSDGNIRTVSQIGIGIEAYTNSPASSISSTMSQLVGDGEVCIIGGVGGKVKPFKYQTLKKK